MPPTVKQEVSEHEEFDVDAFLASTPKPQPQQTQLNVVPPQCPRCLVDMQFGVVVHEDGSQFKYYRCPINRFKSKCYVTSSKEDLGKYLKAVEEQTHPCYTKIAPEKFRCKCGLFIVLAMSKSEKNPGRLYLKCPKKSCRVNCFNGLTNLPEALPLSY